MRQDVAAALSSVLDSVNDLSRCCAARTLGVMGDDQAVPPLTDRLLHDQDADVRMEAAAALGKLASSQATTPLVDALDNDPDGGVRIQACGALGVIADPGALDALIRALRCEEFISDYDWDSGDDMEFNAAWEIQQTALVALGDIGDERAVGAIVRLLEDDDYDDLQEVGFRVLAAIGGERGRAFLLTTLRNGPRRTRRRAAQSLGAMKEPQVTKALIHAVRDREADVRIAVARALAKRNDPDATSALLRLLKDADPEVRSEVAALAATIQSEAVGKLLLRLLGDRHPAVQQQAVEALGARREKTAAKPLLNLLASAHDESLRQAVIISLSQCDVVTATESLCEILADRQQSPGVRFQAALTLSSSSLINALAGSAPRTEKGSNGTPPPETEAAKRLDPLAVLAATLADEHESVRFGALQSLAAVAKKGAQSGANDGASIEDVGERATDILLMALQGDLFAVSAHPDNPDSLDQTHASPGTVRDEDVGAMADVESEKDGEQNRAGHSPHTSTVAAIMAESEEAAEEEARISSERRFAAARERCMELRRQAARVMKELQGPRIYNALLAAVEDDDAALQCEAMRSLSYRETPNDPRIIDVALEKLHSEHREVQLAAVDTLGLPGMMKSAAAADALRRLALHDSNDAIVSERALEALAQFHDREAMETIAERLQANDPNVRKVALQLIKAGGARSAVDSQTLIAKIRPLIFFRGGELRVEAASTLREIGDPGVVASLLSCITNSAEEDQHWIAIEALAEIYKAA